MNNRSTNGSELYMSKKRKEKEVKAVKAAEKKMKKAGFKIIGVKVK